jgi:thiol-disulfide isomerase/thioredoxin
MKSSRRFLTSTNEDHDALYLRGLSMRSCLATLLLLSLLSALVSAQIASKYEGQIVCCEECWARADRRTTPFGTPSDLAKAAECVANGDPTLLAILEQNGETKFFQLEEGTFKKPGQTWLELIGSRVEVTGLVRTRKRRSFLRVDDLRVLTTPGQLVPSPAVIGEEVDLVLNDLTGTEQRLSSLRGRLVVLNFWATWCGPCVKEMPDLASIQNQYAALGVQVVGASANTLAEQKMVLGFIAQMKINFPVWLGATTGEMAKFGLGPALPGTAVIGRDGRIVALYPGIISEAELRGLLDRLIAQSQGEASAKIAQIGRGRSTDTSSVPS